MRHSILCFALAIAVLSGCASDGGRKALASISGLTITGLNIKQNDGTIRHEILLENSTPRPLSVTCDVVLVRSGSPQEQVHKLSKNLYPNSLEQSVLPTETPCALEIDHLENLSVSGLQGH